MASGGIDGIASVVIPEPPCLSSVHAHPSEERQFGMDLLGQLSVGQYIVPSAEPATTFLCAKDEPRKVGAHLGRLRSAPTVKTGS
jgi:hypothetical protein